MKAATLLVIVSISLLAGCLEGPNGWGGEPFDTAPFRVRGMLLNEDFPTLAIRPYYVEGRQPLPEALDWVADRLHQVTGKPTVRIEAPVLLQTGTDSSETNWTSERASDLFQTIEVPWEPGTFNLVVLYLDGYGYSGGKALGFQSEHFLALFPDHYRTSATVQNPTILLPALDGGLAQEKRVLLHEAGHMMGLVNHGAPMQRDHVDRREACLCHSANAGSVMFSAYDSLTDYAMNVTVDGNDFDADDLADLKAFQQARASR